MESYVTAATGVPTPRNRRANYLRGLAVAAIASLCGLLAAAPGASAAPTATTAPVYSTSFGTGELSGGSGLFNGVGVDAGTGNIVATNEAGSEIRVFAPDPILGGTPLTGFAAGVSPFNLVVEGQSGAIYVSSAVAGGGLHRYLSDGAPTPTYTLDPTFNPTTGSQSALTIDPTTGDVMLYRGGQGGALVERLDPVTGALISSVHLATSYFTFGMAVGLDGTFFLAGQMNKIQHYTPTGARLPDIPLNGFAYALAVDPTSGDVVAAVGPTFAPAERLVGFTPSGEKLFDVPMQPATVGGLSIDPSTGRVYVLNLSTGSIDSYGQAPYAGVEPPSVSAVTTAGFHVTTEVDPGAGPPVESTVHFEYSSDGQTWSSTSDQAVAAPGTFEADVSGLEPNVTYLVRAVASNSLTSHVGNAVAVTTAPVPPTTETGTATDVGETSAVLNGTINPIGSLTTFHFEYGPTTAYGSVIPLGIEAVAGNARVAKAFSRTIAGLAPGTTYHFRIVATSAGGTAAGADRTFTTVPVGGIAPRFYEQVTSADKQGVAIVPSLAMQAAPDGNGISYTTKAGSQSSSLLTRSLAVRGSTDWQGKIDTDPPLFQGAGGFLIHPTLAVSDDFNHAFVAANRIVGSEGVEGGLNLYVRNLTTGTYKLVGSSTLSEAFNSFVGATTTGRFQAGSASFSWIVFSSGVPLLPGAPNNAIYRWDESTGLEVESILPNGAPSSALRAGPASVYDTTSKNGSRIYYSATQGEDEAVYLRENGGPPKIVSHPPGEPQTPVHAVLFGTNEDGRYAFLSSSQKLTNDAPGEEGDLYRYDASNGSIEYLGTQAYTGIAADGIQVLYSSLGIGADGNTLYFYANAGGPGPLMVWHDGVVRNVSSSSIGSGEEHSSPNGRYFVLSSEGAIRVYDAETNTLSCVSCLPDGTPVAVGLPSAGGDLLISNREQQVVDDSGEVFFNTTARLVAADVNGTGDVYEYHEGTLRLISPGNRPFDAVFADISPDGRNVYFTTAQKLVGRDTDEAIDIYDARVGGGLPAQSPPPPLECLRDDCKATPNAGPELPFGGSEALSGPGNVVPKKQVKCGKGKRAKKVKGKTKCVKAKPKSKKHASKSKQKANKGGKGGHR